MQLQPDLSDMQFLGMHFHLSFIVFEMETHGLFHKDVSGLLTSHLVRKLEAAARVEIIGKWAGIKTV